MNFLWFGIYLDQQFFIPMTGYAAVVQQTRKTQRSAEGVLIGNLQFNSVSLQFQIPFYPLREGLEIMPANTRIVKIEIFREPGDFREQYGCMFRP